MCLPPGAAPGQALAPSRRTSTGFPLIVVAPNTLGVINQTLQTLITASTFRDGLDVAGIVLNDLHGARVSNDPSTQSNAAELAARCISPILATVGKDFDRAVDWLKLAERR